LIGLPPNTWLNPRGQRWVAHSLFFSLSWPHVYVDRCSALGSAQLVGWDADCYAGP
jgi:hypothetical protein